jgi:ankyrin repeat protein
VVGAPSATHEGIVELLVKYGANVEVEGGEKWTPLHWFARRGNVEAIVSILLHGAAITRLLQFEADVSVLYV